MAPEIGNALLDLTSKTPTFYDQRISQSLQDEEGKITYFVVTAQKAESNVVFTINVGIPDAHLDNKAHWDTLMEAVAEEFNKITIS